MPRRIVSGYGFNAIYLLPVRHRAATRHCSNRDPVNIGSGREISIRNLTCLIADLTPLSAYILRLLASRRGSRGGVWTWRAREGEFGFRAKTEFVEGLRTTIDWYRQARWTGLAA
jgi:GDP-L-fucose synthase